MVQAAGSLVSPSCPDALTALVYDPSASDAPEAGAPQLPSDPQRLPCRFVVDGRTSLSCTCSLVAGGEALVITSTAGDVYEVALPCRLATVHALGCGLLLQRLPFAEELGAADALHRSPSSVFFRADGKMPKEVVGACSPAP